MGPPSARLVSRRFGGGQSTTPNGELAAT